jgi:hypothetical protein
MATTINSLLESANPYNTVQSDAERLSRKWTKSGLLEGLSGQNKKNMAMMLENQAKQLVVETSLTGGGTTSGASFNTGTGEQWAGVALPLVRKIFGQVASKEFVSVQPMNLPAGLVFYLDFQYGTNSPSGQFSTGSASGSLFGQQSVQGDSGFGNAAAGGVYGAGRFGYSINQFSASFNSSNSGSGVFGSTAGASDLNYNSNYVSGSTVIGNIYKYSVSASTLANFDANAVRSFIFTSGSITAANLLQEFTTTNGQVVNFFVSTSAAIAANSSGSGLWTGYYSKTTGFATRGDFEDPQGATSAYSSPNTLSTTSISIPEINVQMRSEAIAAKTRKLKAQWTPEFAQDLNAYHSIDAEAELTSMLSEYISLEIDLEILDMLIENVPTSNTAAWSAKIGNAIDTNTGIVSSNTTGVFYTQMTWFQTLGIKLQKISNLIHQKTLRGGANFMVVSPTVATILESIPGFAADTDGAADTMKYAFGVQKVGQLNSRYKVYKNPYMLENTILLGFRGNQFLECGAVYAPYIPLIMTPLVYDPNTFTPRKGIMTRYAKKMIRPEYYGKVWVGDLNVI